MLEVGGKATALSGLASSAKGGAQGAVRVWDPGRPDGGLGGSFILYKDGVSAARRDFEEDGLSTFSGLEVHLEDGGLRLDLSLKSAVRDQAYVRATELAEKLARKERPRLGER